ncbi:MULTISPECIES: transcriptional regulator [Actinoalloteichus]|uniref:Uncharacterized protein n=1 Tax=Actinoalloteichus fjordicus TaxID=1612552 RepID=A0AAC9LE42_9PSEU|nr:MULTISPECIES: transcriptional regulator [Actinoalloteichus]APU15180.1 hypothetical protein UA74_15640 [Actinoalloteichus fjordicus]APU21249.1 hypothetical protein UA75_16205 [Actinoalloteichus sp. GBA129-24]
MARPTGWTGASACALQAALRLSNESFAARLGIAVRTVAGWHQKSTTRPRPEMQQLLDTTLEQADQAVRERFAALSARPETPAQLSPAEPARQAEPVSAEALRRLDSDHGINDALAWLDDHAGWEPGTARRAVAERLAALDVRELRDRGSRRGRVDQRRIAHALAAYYRDVVEDHGRYTVRHDGGAETETSILTRPGWLDLNCSLTTGGDRLAVDGTPAAALRLDAEAADHGVRRLAETLALDIRLTDMPLYRLTGTAVDQGGIGGTLALSRFVEYACTMDLLEGELVDALATGAPVEPGSLPLRDRHLPDLASVLDLAGRLCAGGTLALCAIARPADPFRGPADYVLLVQERSGHVVNAARRLAVIPKGFHQPMTDVRADARLGATLRREMEEELFGREDIDNTVSDQRRADPMHPSRLSAPMRWLSEEFGRLRMECTGFGLNLVSGNFEFAGVIVVDDEDFWTRFGGEIEANWESHGLRQYSSLDSGLISELIGEVAWSNEGLFAMLQGLRRLSEIGGDRVNLPAMNWEVRE